MRSVSWASHREDGRQRRPVRKHVVGVDPARTRRARGGRPARDGALVLMTGMGAGLTGVGVDRMDGTAERTRGPRRQDGKDRFLFPGQGALEAGMGREMAEAVPRHGRLQIGARPRGSTQEALLRLAARGSGRDRGAAAGARRDGLAILAAYRRGLEPTSSSATRSASSRARRRSARSARRRRSRLVRERGLAMAEAARDARLDGRDPRARGRGRRDAVQEDPRRVAGELQLPRPDRHSGENDAVEECCAEAESLGARRAIRLKVSGAFHSPLVAKAAERLRPAIDGASTTRSRRSCRR